MQSSTARLPQQNTKTSKAGSPTINTSSTSPPLTTVASTVTPTNASMSVPRTSPLNIRKNAVQNKEMNSNVALDDGINNKVIKSNFNEINNILETATHERNMSADISSNSVVTPNTDNINACVLQYNDSAVNSQISENSNIKKMQLESSTNDERKAAFVKEDDREESVNSSCASTTTCSSKVGFAASGINNKINPMAVKALAQKLEDKEMNEEHSYSNNMSPVSFLTTEKSRNNLKSDKSDNCGNSKDAYILITEASNTRNSTEIVEGSTGSLNFPLSEALQVCPKPNVHSFTIKSKDFCPETTIINKVSVTVLDSPMHAFNSLSYTNANTKSNTIVNTTENLTNSTNVSKSFTSNTGLNKYSKNSSESVANTYKSTFVNSTSNVYTCSSLNTQNITLYTNANLYVHNTANTHSITTTNSNVNGSAMVYTNSVEYMQQQNHIFVFSTQLANKGAEAVLNGQFPTIIAYHCTQPATRIFLEDFFFKNSIKMKKLQRENNLNVCQISIGGNGGVAAQSWLPKSHKCLIKAKGIFHLIESLPMESEVLYWNRSRQAFGSHTGDSNPAKISGSAECDIKSAALDSDIGIPSLQGVKVPDENLTPQQRQHREEQLAKLKKMNQFLFPESECSEYHADTTRSSINKLPVEDMTTTLNSNALNNITFSGNSSSNKITHSIRNATSGILSQSNPSSCNTDIICGAAEILMASDIISDNEITSCLPNTNAQSHVNSPSHMNSVANTLASNINIMGNTMPISINQITNLTSSLSNLANTSLINLSSNELTCRESNSSMQESMGAVTPNASETLSAYNTNFSNENNVILHESNKNRIFQIDINQSENQNEWSKLQYQFYEQQIRVNVLDISQPLSRNNTSNARPTPPPPYHTTQRSASVPITTQSPNPSSPNNHTSNLSLPSPCTSGAVGNATNSPNLDASITTILPTTSTTSVLTGNSNSARNRVNTNALISSPVTSMGRLSPKGVDSNNMNNLSEGHTSIKASPQKSRSPLISVNNTTENIDLQNVDQKLSTQALSYSTNAICSTTGITKAFISQNLGLERQTVAQTNCIQFNRQLDNIPLNPNSQRTSQNKLINSFDPISSLAQMSQQLTGCNSVNIGSTINNIGVLGAGSSVCEINSSSNINMENIASVNSCTPDQCNLGTIGNIPVTVNALTSYGSNNSQIMMGSAMGQRLINSKTCGGNVSGFNKSLRENSNSFQGSTAGTRILNKMPTNFGNFNVTSNIQVKASTPNTIQYMPVRSQSTGSNKIQTPPSLEFLQRFANPQLLNAHNSNAIMDNSININHINVSNEPHKVTNILNNIGANMALFNNNSQLNSIAVMEQDEPQNNSNNDSSLNSNLFRGIQHIRQSNIGQDRTSSPHFHPSVAVNTSAATHNPLGFTSSEPDSMNINESSHNSFANNASSLYQSRQNKMVGISQSTNATNGIISNAMLNNGFASNDHMSPTTLHSPVMLNPNTLNTTGNLPMNYKSYIGPNTSNLKYAQQYHSFQQQLYATSTRNHHVSNQPNIHSNTNMNANYFTNK